MILDQQGISYEWDPFSEDRREVPAGENLALGTVVRTLIESYLEVIDTLTKKIDDLEPVIEERAASLEETQLLMSIPGARRLSTEFGQATSATAVTRIGRAHV